MSEADQIEVDRIEADRRRRERELLLLLLLFAGDSRRRAVYAVKLGHDPISAARDPWLGNPSLEHEGAAPVIAAQLADVHLAGVRRAHKLAGVPKPPVDDTTAQQLIARYTPDAQDFAERTWTVIESKLSPAITAARPDGIAATIKAIRLAFGEAAVTKQELRSLEIGTELAVVRSYNDGLWVGGHMIADPLHHLVGFEHVSVLDLGTTDICRQRNGLKLPPDADYWKRNHPPLHFGCRSIIRPLFGRTMVASETLPSIPPAPGFGLAPSADLGSFFNVTR